MFPVLTLEVSGLEPEARYFVVMEICLSSDRRYKFVGAEWKATGKAEPQLAPSSRLFIHQDSPATGTHWMREPIKMKSAKLTNNPLNRSGHVSISRACADPTCCISRTFRPSLRALITVPNADSRSERQEIPRILSNPKIDIPCSQNPSTLDLILSHLNPVHTFPTVRQVPF
jgi:hypothetical protein